MKYVSNFRILKNQKEELALKNYYEYEQQQNYMNRKNDIEIIAMKNDSDENYESSNQEILYQYSQQTKFVPKENDEARHPSQQKNNVLSNFNLI
jgi:hypothetical protein